MDKGALRRRYAQERDKRLRPDGNDQYLRLTGEFTRYLDDPSTPRTERAPLTGHRTVTCVGGGFAGLVTAVRLRQAGVDVRIIEKGGGFGGTWYWNRYPGAQCDTASMVYLPLLEETGHIPTEKYVHGPEILAHCEHIGAQFGLYDDALFHTEVTGLTWDQAQARWRVETSRWDYDYTGRDPGTASKLKAWYRQLCKRPCFHDEYLQAFNRPNTHLVDTGRQGVDRITAAGLARGQEYALDCIIYASGFEVGTPCTRRAGFEVTGRDGTLSQCWAGGMRTLHGIHARGFPNLLFVQPTQGANLISNVPHNIVDSAQTIALTIRHALDREFAAVEPSQEAQDAWVALLASGPGSAIGGPDCTPGYYNNEGQDSGAFLGRGYPNGPSAYFAYIDKWRASGTFDGLEFR